MGMAPDQTDRLREMSGEKIEVGMQMPMKCKYFIVLLFQGDVREVEEEMIT